MARPARGLDQRRTDGPDSSEQQRVGAARHPPRPPGGRRGRAAPHTDRVPILPARRAPPRPAPRTLHAQPLARGMEHRHARARPDHPGNRAPCWCGITVMPDLHRTVLELRWRLACVSLFAKIEHGVEVNYITCVAIARVHTRDDWIPDVNGSHHPDVRRTEAAKVAEVWTSSPVVSPRLLATYPPTSPSTPPCCPACSRHTPTRPDSAATSAAHPTATRRAPRTADQHQQTRRPGQRHGHNAGDPSRRPLDSNALHPRVGRRPLTRANKIRDLGLGRRPVPSFFFRTSLRTQRSWMGYFCTSQPRNRVPGPIVAVHHCRSERRMIIGIEAAPLRGQR